MMRFLIHLIAFSIVFATATSAFATEVRRFALLIAANDGGPSRPTLRFAESDARELGGVLSHMGGVQRTDEIYVMSATVVGVDRAFEKMRQKLADAAEEETRLELITYYSGHSDEYGLLLGEEKYGYAQFREQVESLPADVRILILDSCASGAIIRHKGGERRASFLIDESSDVEGQAIVTSSSIDEAAQESDDIGGSYFTHFLVSGLRGAADQNGDARITLNEAYEFAFANTLQATNQTAAGAQHPGYDFQLKGHGDVVLTMFTPRTSTLVVDKDVVGRVFVWTEAQRLAIEVSKQYGKNLELGLAPGRYSVTVARGGQGWQADIKMPEIGRRKLSLRDFSALELTPTRSRGSSSEAPTVRLDRGPRPRLPWYRHVIIPAAALAGATSIGALIHAGNLEREREFYLDNAIETYSYFGNNETDPQYREYADVREEYIVEARRIGDKARGARTVAIVSAGAATALVLGEVAFRLFSKGGTTLALSPAGRLDLRASF